MAIIDFRIRPPFKSFLASAMYKGAARRDGITRKVGFEPSPAAVELSIAKLIGEMVNRREGVKDVAGLLRRRDVMVKKLRRIKDEMEPKR